MDKNLFKEPWLNPNAFEHEPTPSRIIHYILGMVDQGSKEFTYIVFGRTGPTGKTLITKTLRDNGFKALEITEDMRGLVGYIDSRNHFIVNNDNKYVVIVLNSPWR